MKQFFNSILSKFMEVSYSTDNRYKIFSCGIIRLKFRRQTFNWYKPQNDIKRINKYWQYKQTRKANGVIYTCITNNYDDICEIESYKYINKDWDYVFFTDNEEQIKQGKIGIWEVKPLQYKELDNTRNNRWHKLNPHLLFPDYKESIYIDANINILTPYLFNVIKNKDSSFVLPKHYKNKCIYSEYQDVLDFKLDNEEIINKELEIIKQAGMPKNFGFCENNILYRKHHDKTIKKIDEEWWYMVKNYAKRDQLALCYLLWKYGFDISKITFNNSRFNKKNLFLFPHKNGRKQKSVLITGGAGFIGSTLADRLLKEGQRVTVIDNFNGYYDIKLKKENVKKNLSNINYKLYKGDICNSKLIKKVLITNQIDTVVHIAARAGVRPSLEDPLEYVRSNIEGTVNLLENIKQCDIKKIIFASSSSVYGNCKADKFSEDLKVTEPISPYAATKSACEQILYTYSKLYGINTVCLRFFTVYGPKQRPDLAIRKFIELIEQDKPIPIYGDGSTMRDYTFIEDIIDGICAAIDYNKTPYEIINLGGGSPVTLNEMISTIEEVLGKTAKKNYLPMQLGDVNKTISDITKAQKLLGYQPKTTFKEGVKKFVEWKKNK